MKNRIAPIWVALAILVNSCGEDGTNSPFPSDLPRFDDLVQSYTNILWQAPNGWKVVYQPDDQSGGFTILMQFDSDGRVRVQSDLVGFHEEQDNVSYRVGGTVAPELTFESYCVWHEIYEQSDGDFEFTIHEATNDEILLSPVNQPYCVYFVCKGNSR